MELDIDTFLVALYSIVDDLYKKHFAPLKPNRPGPRPELSDSEVLTLLICAQWLGPSEREFGRYAARHWRCYFPRLLSQGAFNRRARDLCGVLVHMVPLVAEELGAYLAGCEILDGVPVPLERRCRGQYHRLFADEAQIGKGGSDKDWYFGPLLLLAVTKRGVITGFLLAPANTEIHWVGEALLCWRADPNGTPWTPADLPPSHRRGGGYVGPTGPIWPRDGVGKPSQVPYLGDGGFRGEAWAEHWQKDYQAWVFTRDKYQGEEAGKARHQHSSWRQVIETVNNVLDQALHLKFLGARSKWGLLTRVAAKLVAFNLGIWLNRLFGRPDFAVATLFSS